MTSTSADKIDAAIATAAAEPLTVTLDLPIGPGRIVTIRTPIDMDPQEAINLIGAIARDLPGVLVEAVMRSQGARMIETPRGPHLVRPT